MRLSVQLYTLRDPLEQDLAGTLDKVKAIGLEYVELAGFYGKTAEEWKTLLAERGLKVSGAHIPLNRFQDELDAVLAEAELLDIPTLIVPWIGADGAPNGWGEVGKSLEPIAEKVVAAGRKFAYHNHAHEFEGGGMDAFYEASDPKLVQAELDLAWVKIGGEDPAAYVRKYAGRVPLVHLKDYDPTQTPQWRPAGTGVIDYDSVLAACEEVGVEYGCIELDLSPGDPIEAVRESYEFLNSKGLK